MKIGAKIKRIRELNGLSQEKLADELKMSVTGYGKIERGEVSVSLNRLDEIAKVLKVSVEQIIILDERLPINQFQLNQQVIEATRLSWEMKQLYEDKIALLLDKISYLESELAKYKVG